LTAAITVAAAAAAETAMTYMRGSAGSCPSGHWRAAAVSRLRGRKGTSVPVSISHLDRCVMIAGRGVTVSHSYRLAVYVRQVPDLYDLVTSARPPLPLGMNSTFTTPGGPAWSFVARDARPPAKGGTAAMRNNIWG